jgi:hypothetical protein
VKDSQEAAFLRSTPCKIARLIDLSVEHLVPKVMEETANLGVDGIIENNDRSDQHFFTRIARTDFAASKQS